MVKLQELIKVIQNVKNSGKELNEVSIDESINNVMIIRLPIDWRGSISFKKSKMHDKKLNNSNYYRYKKMQIIPNHTKNNV